MGCIINCIDCREEVRKVRTERREEVLCKKDVELKGK